MYSYCYRGCYSNICRIRTNDSRWIWISGTYNNNNNSSSNNSEKIDFNDELKKQIAVAGEAYVEFYFEHGEGTAPSAFAEKAYEDTENDTPLGEYKEQGKTIFMNAFKEAYEATGNEYY